MRLIQRNKNLLNDLINKQNFEAKRILDGIKQNMELTKVDKLYIPERKVAISLPPQRKNAGQGRVSSASKRVNECRPSSPWPKGACFTSF